MCRYSRPIVGHVLPDNKPTVEARPEPSPPLRRCDQTWATELDILQAQCVSHLHTVQYKHTHVCKQAWW